MTIKELKRLRSGDRVKVDWDYGYCDEVDDNIGRFCEVIAIYGKLVLVKRCDKKDFGDKYNQLTGQVRLYNYAFLTCF